MSAVLKDIYQRTKDNNIIKLCGEECASLRATGGRDIVLGRNGFAYNPGLLCDCFLGYRVKGNMYISIYISKKLNRLTSNRFVDKKNIFGVLVVGENELKKTYKKVLRLNAISGELELLREEEIGYVEGELE